MKWIKYSVYSEYCNQAMPKYSRVSKNKYNESHVAFYTYNIDLSMKRSFAIIMC